ncbi:Exosome complex exonuclease RRP44 [Nymphon striatum]|nr:Exosome complex exonuclease RRP44 [Nymphon striatum]
MEIESFRRERDEARANILALEQLMQAKSLSLSSVEGNDEKMLKSKTFNKKTKKGGIIKVVREHYLRDDIWCGSKACEVCPIDDAILEKQPASESNLFTECHYLLPDTNVVLHQIDILEDPAIKNVIILQVVLEEVRHRNMPVYARLKTLISNKERHFYCFTNEHHRETYIERLPQESANDRNDRAIRVSAKWYNDHFASLESKAKPSIALITNDADNLKKAETDNICVSTIEEFVKSLTKHPTLMDRLSKKSDSSLGGSNSIIFPEHLASSVLHAGVKAGKYLQGTFFASRDNFLEGTVSVEGKEQMILIRGRINLNRAVHDDHVAIEILPESEWTAPSDIVLEEENVDEEKEVENVKSSNSCKNPTGKIIGIIKRNWRQYCGMLRPSVVSGGTRHIFVPAEKRIPKIRIETRQVEFLQTQKIVVVIDSWSKTSRYPNGHFVRALGNIGEKDTENEVLLLEHDIPHLQFSEEVLDCLPSLPWIITEKDEEKRVDLRDIAICSVDPPGCTDIDDALHCRNLDNGLLEVGVHIADVSHFIRPGTAIDKEAASRGTTVYLVDKRIDMVPDLLSSNLCSLRSNEERFAVSCVWTLTHDAEIVNVKFHKSIINSKAAFTYEQAQLRIDDATKHDDVTIGLRNLNKLAKVLKQKRKDAGALVLASPEVRFSMDTETHDPISVETKQLRETNSMVEEFMLLANVTVAKKILEEFSECALLRRHPSPPPSNFDPLIKAASTKGFKINIDNGKNLADSLDNCVIESDPYFNTMLRILATRCMMQAVYFCCGMITESEYFHYGLAAGIYTHFTSPIRRYSDVIVHRLLAAAIAADSTYPELLDKRKIQSLCNNLNYRHKMAQYAGRASVDLHTQIFFNERVMHEEAYVLFVRKNALQILIPKFGLQGNLFLDNKDSDIKFIYDEHEPSQTACGVKIHLFEMVVVEISIDKKNIQHQKMSLKLVSPVIPGFSVPSLIDSSKKTPPPQKKHVLSSKINLLLQKKNKVMNTSSFFQVLENSLKETSKIPIQSDQIYFEAYQRSGVERENHSKQGNSPGILNLVLTLVIASLLAALLS